MKDQNIVVDIPQITSIWTLKDHLGTLRVRSSIGRNHYTVTPGLYQLGVPDKQSDVFVTANYKLSFDILRRNLAGMDAWILVLDTKGINVWCAAGKGTFGTGELIRRIDESGLQDIVSHRRLIVPQLGAPGVAGHLIKEQTGFKVKFGPVQASDIKPFIASDYKKDEAMRTVPFNFSDRLILTPVEIVNSWKPMLLIMAFFVALSGLTSTGYSFDTLLSEGLHAVIYLGTAYVAGAFLTPVLLPYLPSRYFAGKGMATAVLIFAILLITGIAGGQVPRFAGWFLISASISSFLAMNFTGASTYTSLSGVKKEMKLFVPVQIVLAATGFVLIVLSQFLWL